MKILGVWDGHNASAALVVDGKLVGAVAEERLSRQKMQRGFPFAAIKAVLELGNIGPGDVEQVALGGQYGRTPMRLLNRTFSKRRPGKGPQEWPARLSRHYENRVASLPLLREVEARAGRLAVKFRLQSLGIPSRTPVVPVEHHTAHAASAASLFQGDACLVTVDGYGDGLSATAWNKSTDGITLTASRRYLHSVAVTYGAVCQTLGFKEGDEGKVTALAAHGNPMELFHWFRELLSAPSLGTLSRRQAMYLAGFAPAEVAAGMQTAMEEQVLRLLQEVVPADAKALGLAGGLFANVTLNRKLAAMFSTTDIRVYPAMGDDGLSAGAASYLALKTEGSIPEFPGPFLGQEPDTSHLAEDAAHRLLRVRRDPQQHGAAAAILANGGTIALVRGREEFGPRALGNRSLLFPATDHGLADRVQTMLSRNPVMPFAPVCRDIDVAKLVAGDVPAPSRDDFGLDLMTFAVKLKDWVAKKFPVATHVDGTARLHAVTRDSSPLLYDLLSAYAEVTGDALLINTSFNLHGDPIVHDTPDALDTFVRAGVDCMLLGPYLVSRVT